MKRESGYTIMEVGLALAISGSMLFMAASLHNMSNRQRFNDAINGTKTFIERQYNDVRFGINGRVGGSNLPAGLKKCATKSAVTAGDSDCYIIGRLLEFKRDRIVVSYIVAMPDRTTADGRAWDNPEGVKDSPAYIIYKAANRGWLKVLPSNAGDPDIGSRATERLYGDENILMGAWNVARNADPKELDVTKVAAAILHSPIGGSVMTYTDVKLDGSTSSSEVRTLSFEGSKDMSKIGSYVNLLNNTLGLVLYIQRDHANASYSVAYCIPSQGTSAGVQSNAPVPFSLRVDRPGDKDNLIGVCDEATKSKR